MGLKDQVFIGGVWTDTALTKVNTVGTPVLSAVVNLSGEAISDTYTITISNKTGPKCTVTINAASPNNPYKGNVFTNQLYDGTTVYPYYVPGVDIVLATAVNNGDAVTITLGTPYGTFDASGVSAGIPTDGVQHRVLNAGTAGVISAAVKLLTQVIQVGIVGRPLVEVAPFARSAIEKIAGAGSGQIVPYAFTFAGTIGTGTAKTVNLSVDGTLVDAILLDTTTGETVTGTGLHANGLDTYRFLSGPLQDVEFVISTLVTNGDKVNVLIFYSRYIQVAPDVAGAPGPFGTADVPLTEAGQADGIITASGVAYYWTRFLVPSSANNESNPYPARLALSGSQSGGAGWEE